jgi:hypothetical protein
MKFEFLTEKTTLNRLWVGDLFYYNRKICMVVNGAPNQGGKLIRAIGPGSQTSCVKPYKTKVTYLIRGKKIKE